MKVLLFLNGPEGCQTGIEEGFSYLHRIGRISDLKWVYFNAVAIAHNEEHAKKVLLSTAEEFKPDLIAFFHIGGFGIDETYLDKFKKLQPRPLMIYDEGDMYGTWAKSIRPQMKVIMRKADAVSIRGLGAFYTEVKKYNKHIFYTPHHNDLGRFDTNYSIKTERTHDICLIGNRIKPRLLSSIRRLPGAKEREEFVQLMGKEFPEKFKLYGNGWNGFVGNQGPVDFYQQHDVYRDSWITAAYEHYPNIPYYFSNRLPIALMNGSLYVCHYHEGYENIFPSSDFIFSYKKMKDSVDILHFLLSMDKSQLLKRCEHARQFAIENYHPHIIWSNFLNNALKCY
jgi:hypothetical protein